MKRGITGRLVLPISSDSFPKDIVSAANIMLASSVSQLSIFGKSRE